MVYRILYYLVNVLIRVFYRKLYINGLENIDKSKTYLITSNHPNGFFEPLIMACTFPIDLYFMVRGDMFEKPLMNWFLRSTHQIPIYRFVDGFAKMKENQSSLKEATQTLSEGKSIMLFAEGSTEALMRCRPIQKGTAKMAFQAFDEYPDLELQILPVGINFNNWRSPGSEVIVNIGNPFDAKPYYQDNIEQLPKGILTLTRDIETRMKEQIIHVNDVKDEPVIRKLWDLINLKMPSGPRKTSNNKIFIPLKNLANEMNSNGGNIHVSEINSLYDKARKANKNKRLLGVKSWWKYILVAVAIPGALFHLVPVYLGYRMRNKKVKRAAFAAPVLGITSFILSIVFYLISFIVLSLTIGIGNALLILFIVIASGFCYVLFWENTKKVSKSKLGPSFFTSLDNLLDQMGYIHA